MNHNEDMQSAPLSGIRWFESQKRRIFQSMQILNGSLFVFSKKLGDDTEKHEHPKLGTLVYYGALPHKLLITYTKCPPISHPICTRIA